MFLSFLAPLALRSDFVLFAESKVSIRMSWSELILSCLLLGSAAVSAQENTECPADFVSFEVITGFVYTAPADMLDSQPGTLILNDCIETCRKNSSCKSINFETGLCVLFSSSADDNKSQLTKSQYPVFTIYVQKNCLPSAASCNGAWSFERVMDHQLDTEVSSQSQGEDI